MDSQETPHVAHFSRELSEQFEEGTCAEAEQRFVKYFLYKSANNENEEGASAKDKLPIITMGAKDCGIDTDEELQVIGKKYGVESSFLCITPPSLGGLFISQR